MAALETWQHGARLTSSVFPCTSLLPRFVPRLSQLLPRFVQLLPRFAPRLPQLLPRFAPRLPQLLPRFVPRWLLRMVVAVWWGHTLYVVV